jgi:polyhydroxyalkanoate synthesis regulator phasin
MYEASRRILLAAIGAAAIAQEEMEDFIKRLVDRGEIAEKEGKKLMNEMLEKRKEKRKSFEAEMNKRLHAAADCLDVPSKKDIDELSAKIAELTRKVEELKKTKE